MLARFLKVYASLFLIAWFRIMSLASYSIWLKYAQHYRMVVISDCYNCWLDLITPLDSTFNKLGGGLMSIAYSDHNVRTETAILNVPGSVDRRSNTFEIN